MSFVLDTTAIISYLSDLRGSDLIEELLDNAAKGKAKVHVSYVTIAELYHVIGTEFSQKKANESVAAVKSWPVSLTQVDEGIALAAGRLMVQEEIPFEDAIVIATALDKKATVVTANPKLAQAFEDTIVIGRPDGG